MEEKEPSVQDAQSRPAEEKKAEHHHHHHHHHHSGHHHHRHKHFSFGHMRRSLGRFWAAQKLKFAPGTPGNKLARRAGFALLVVLIPTVIIVTASHIERRNGTVDAADAIYGNSTPGGLPAVNYKGKAYVPKTNVESYLFLGIDAQGPVKGVTYIGGGQADSLYLVVLDRRAKEWSLLQINRDIITDVQVLGVFGDVISTKKAQIALAHSYGDGMKTSCRNTVQAVSNLLGGIETYGYASLNMDGIRTVVDGFGGVDVTLTESYPELDEAMLEGATVHMDGELAYRYLRSRKDVGDQTNLDRMDRQRSFLRAAIESAPAITESRGMQILRDAEDYMVSDMQLPEIWKVAELLQSYSFREILTIDGKSRVENGFNAFYPNESSLQETVLRLFYTLQ